jgi:hypothetical protein
MKDDARTKALRTVRVSAWSAVALVVALAGCGRKDQASTAAPTASATMEATGLASPSGTYNAGDKVDIEWRGSFYPGVILSVSRDTYRVHYTGWSSTWDETVPGSRLRAPTGTAKVVAEPKTAAPAAGAKAVATWRPGASVDVNWKGSWYQGRVLSVSGGLYRIHYIGWASSWDETVPASRLRAATGSARRGSGPA